MNITSISFDSNQSVYIHHNLTLWYRRAVSTTTTTWDVGVSGDPVRWNVTVTLSYPTGLTGGIMRYVNITKMTDWSATGIYASTSPSVNHDNLTVLTPTVVRYSNMTSDTWTATFSAHNYVTDILADPEVLITDSLSITNLLHDASSRNVTTASTNLTVSHQGTTVWNPPNETVTNGATTYLWDIDTTTSDNGTYTIEVYWSNGTEAGYRTFDVLVIYPTELTTDRVQMEAFIESSFDIRVYFNETYTPQGLTGASCSVTYSFGSVVNDTMVDQNNGTWTKTINTVGMAVGTYQLTVYAEGYAIQNQSLTIQVKLTYETNPLTVSWSNGDNITYLQQTNLTVQYTYTNGTSITDATVNVTDGTHTWDLHYDSAHQWYWIQFNGSDLVPGIGTHALNVSAWKLYHHAQYNNTLTLIIRNVQTTISVSWTSTTIHYTETAMLVVNYTDLSSNLIPAASQKDIVINGTTYTLSGDNGTYYYVFDNSLGLGHFEVSVTLDKYGYEQATKTGITVDIIETPTGLTVYWTPANVTIDYTQSLNLQVDYTYDGHDVPATAVVNVTLDGHVYTLSYTGTIWNVTIPGAELDIGTYNAVIEAWLYGYQYQTNTTLNVNITLAPNSFLVYWTPSDMNATYTQTVHVSVIYTHDNQPVQNATVRLYVNGTRTYNLTYSSVDERWHLDILGSEFGLGIWNVTVVANKTGYDTGRDVETLRVDVDPCVVTTNWVNYNLYYTHQVDLNVTVNDSHGIPITDALVNVTYNTNWYILAHIGQGVYRLVLNGSDGLGTYPIDIAVNRFGIVNRSINVNLNIIDTPMNGSIVTTIGGYNTSILYLDGWIMFTVTIQDVDANPMTGLAVNLTLKSQLYQLTEQGAGVYRVNLTGANLGIGTYNATFETDTYGYTNWNETIQFDVVSMPTETIPFSGEVPAVMYVNQTVEVVIEYRDVHRNTTLSPSSISATWASNPLQVDEIAPGRLRFVLSAVGVPVGDHLLQITISRTNFSDQIVQSTITIRLIHTSISTEASFSQYEQEHLQISVTFTDLDRNIPVSWGTVQMKVGTSIYNMTYDSTHQYYTLDFILQLASGSYVITFTGSAEGCETSVISAQLIVNAKTLYQLTMNVGQAVEGATLGVTVTLTRDGNPIMGKEITVSMSEDGAVHNKSAITNSEGIAEVTFDIPLGTRNVTVWATFKGSVSEWAIVTDPQNVEVRPPIGFTDQLFGFISTPIGMLTITALGIAIIGAVVYFKVQKPKQYKRVKKLSNQYQYFNMLRSLKHFMAIYLNRGTCVVYHPFGKSRIQPDLISGFISAISTVYGEITGGGERGTLEEIQYHDLRLNSFSGQYIVGVLISEGEISTEMRFKLKQFVEKFEDHFKDLLTDWEGLLDGFDPQWIVKTLYDSFEFQWMLPHTINESKKVKGIEKKVRDILMKHKNSKGFIFLADVLADVSLAIGKSRAETLDILLKMVKRDCLTPIDISADAYRVGSSIVCMDEQIAEPEEQVSVDESTAAPAEAEEEPSEKDSIEEFIENVESILKAEKEKAAKENPDDEVSS